MFQSDPTYAAMIENLDTNIGALLHTLDENGLAENTLVVFTSDNGGLATVQGSPTCNLPLAEGKGWNQEGGTPVSDRALAGGGAQVRAARWRRPAPTTTRRFLEAAGLPLRPAQHCDGLSLMGLLTGRTIRRRRQPHARSDLLALSALLRPGRHASRGAGQRKLEAHRGSFRRPPGSKLFDLVDDPSETRNLAAAARRWRPKLHGLLRAWQQEVAAKMPRPIRSCPAPAQGRQQRPYLMPCPFDRQKMQIILESKKNKIDKLRYVPLNSESGMDKAVAFIGWNIGGGARRGRAHLPGDAGELPGERGDHRGPEARAASAGTAPAPGYGSIDVRAGAGGLCGAVLADPVSRVI